MADDNAQDQEAAQTAAEGTDDQAVEAARDAERALEAIQAEAASELEPPSAAQAEPVAPAASAAAEPAAAEPAAAEPAAADRTDGPRQNRRKVREGIVVSDAHADDRGRRRGRARAPPQVRQDGAAHQEALRARRRGHGQGRRPGPGPRDPPVSKLKRWRLTEVVERAR